MMCTAATRLLFSFCAVVTESGRVLAFGANGCGQLGLGDAAGPRQEPTAVGFFDEHSVPSMAADDAAAGYARWAASPFKTHGSAAKTKAAAVMGYNEDEPPPPPPAISTPPGKRLDYGEEEAAGVPIILV